MLSESYHDMVDEKDLADRVDELERAIETRSMHESGVSRRELLSTGSLAGLGGLASGSRSGKAARSSRTESDAAGSVGGPDTPVDVYANRLAVGGAAPITDPAGENLAIEDGVLNAAGGGGEATEDYEGRPLFLDSHTAVDVSADGSGDYASLQAALDEELPWLVNYEIDFVLSGDHFDEHVVVPPYTAAWTAANRMDRSSAETVPIQIDGTTGTKLDSITFNASTGVAQVRDIEFVSDTGSGGVDDEDAHVAVYDTNRVGIVGCRSGSSSATRFCVCYGGCVRQAQTTNVGSGNLRAMAKIKQWGKYIENGTIEGSMDRMVEFDEGIALVNDDGNNEATSKVMGGAHPSQGGFVYDMGNQRVHGMVNGIVMEDRSTGDHYEVYVENGSLETSELQSN